MSEKRTERLWVIERYFPAADEPAWCVWTAAGVSFRRADAVRWLDMLRAESPNARYRVVQFRRAA